MNKKIVNSILVIIGIVAIALLFMGGNTAVVDESVIVSENGTEIPCLPNGHQALAQHIHPVLTIFVDGEQEVLPGNIGIEGSCMREIHTHDATGVIHIETTEPDTVYTLPDFFAVWGQSLEREGFAAIITKDGEEMSPDDLVMEDASVIEVVYTKI